MGRSGFWIFILLIVAVVVAMVVFAQADLAAADSEYGAPADAQ